MSEQMSDTVVGKMSECMSKYIYIYIGMSWWGSLQVKYVSYVPLQPPYHVPLMSLLFSHYVPMMSLLVLYYVSVMSMLFPYCFAIMCLVFPNYIPIMSLLFP